MHVHVQVRGRLADELDRNAETTGLSRAALMRLALSEYVESRRPSPNAVHAAAGDSQEEAT